MRVGRFDSGEDVDDGVGIFALRGTGRDIARPARGRDVVQRSNSSGATADSARTAARYRAGTFDRGGHGAARQHA